MQTQTHDSMRANGKSVYRNDPEHARSDALAAPFTFNPRKPRIALETGGEGPELILHYLRYAPWSAKVEMALRHMGLLGSKVLIKDVDILAWFNPKHSPVAHLWNSEIPRMIPLLEDVRRRQAIANSTPIMHYLERRFPDAPPLFAGPARDIERFCIEIDSGLALSARRLFVTKLVLDRRDVLGWVWGGAHHSKLTRGWRALVHQTLMSSALVTRLGLADNVEEGLYERVRTQMNSAATTLGERRWVFDKLGAADTALAASIASLTWVPWLREDPRYGRLFSHQQRVYARLGMEHTEPSIVQGILDRQGQRRGSLRRVLGMPYRMALTTYLWLTPTPRPGAIEQTYGQVSSSTAAAGSQNQGQALNDQRPLRIRGILAKAGTLLDSKFRVQRQRIWLETGSATRDGVQESVSHSGIALG